MNKYLLVLLLLIVPLAGISQNRVYTKTGVITFFSKTTIETIEAKNKRTLAVIDFSANKIEIATLIKGFEFRKALMQEHFNENYLESDTYPKAVFKGNFDEPGLNIPLNENKNYNLKVTGYLTLHGITKPLNTTAVITVLNNSISASADFIIRLSDYNIKVPSVVANNINKEIQVNIQLPLLQQMK